MKPLSDSDIKKILAEKLNTQKAQDYDHLWQGIEGSLPSKSSSFPLAIITRAILLMGVLSIILFSDSKVFQSDSTEITKNLNTIPKANTIGTTSVKEVDGSQSFPKSKDASKNPSFTQLSPTTYVKQSAKTTSNQLAELDRQPIVERLDSNHVFSVPSEGDTPQNANSKNGSNSTFHSDGYPFLSALSLKAEEVPIAFPVIRLSPENKTRPKMGYWFWSASSYLSYHKLKPSLIDESLITADPANKPKLSDRTGVNVFFGRTSRFTERISLGASIGLDYYRTKFYFLVVNDLNPETRIENNRIDGSINIMLDYRAQSVIGTGAITFDIGTRFKLIDIGGSDSKSYLPTILTYRISYLHNFNNFQVGPMYSSFLSSINYQEYGKIVPSIFGVTVRKRIRSQPD